MSNFMERFLSKAQGALIALFFASCFCVLFAGSAFAATTEVDGFTVDRSYSYGSYTVKVTKYNAVGSAVATDITLPVKAKFNDTEYTVEKVAVSFTEEQKNKIKSVTIPEGYTEIDTGAFKGMTALETVNIPATMTAISSNAFEGCTALKAVNFAEGGSRLQINMNAFNGCTALEEIHLPAHFTGVGNYRNPFRNCSALQTITVNEENTKFFTAENALYMKDGESAVLIAYPAGVAATDFTVPETANGLPVTTIGAFTFSGSKNLNKVVFSKNVIELKGFGFYENCENIKEIVLLAEELTLGNYDFDGLADDLTITVVNEAVKAAVLEKKSDADVVVDENAGSNTPVTDTVEAVLSLGDTPVFAEENSNITYTLYLDQAKNVNALKFEMEFDAEQVEKSEILPLGELNLLKSEWTEKNGKLILTAVLGTLGENTGFSIAEKTAIASVSVKVQDGVTGDVTATLSDAAAAAGITDAENPAVDGKADINPQAATATYTIISFDINGDGGISLADVAEAQRYYRIASDSADWSAAKVADVNRDNIVNLEDLVLLLAQIAF